MLPPDIAAQMQGGGAPQGGGGMPPDIGALMAQLGGGQGAPQEDPEAPSIVDGEHGGGEEALTAALDALQAAIDAEADQEDVQVMLQCQTKLQAILAKNQAEADAGLKGSASPKAMRKQAAGAMAGGGQY